MGLFPLLVLSAACLMKISPCMPSTITERGTTLDSCLGQPLYSAEAATKHGRNSHILPRSQQPRGERILEAPASCDVQKCLEPEVPAGIPNQRLGTRGIRSNSD